MPHLLIEIARDVLERQMLSIPIEVDADGVPSDILAPPLDIQRSLPTPFGIVRVQLIVRSVRLQPVVGSGQAIIAMTFDESSIESLSLGKGVGLLSGNVSASILFVTRSDIGPNGSNVARLGIDLSASVVTFQFDDTSRGRLREAINDQMATLIENAIAAMLSAQLQSVGFREAGGFKLGLRPGVPSEDLLTVEALPNIGWVDPQTLSLALRYADEPSPPPFQPIPFLSGKPSAFGMRLSKDGFQRTVRNPAIRKLARDMLTERRINDFVQNAFVTRGGSGEVTDGDRAEGAKQLNAYLETPQGRVELEGEIPSPMGGGALRKHISNVPAPFSAFDVEIPELDLWLGVNRIEGRAVAHGSVNGFRFTATIRFRATPMLVDGTTATIELHDLEIDDPDIDIDLPFWLEWGTVVLASVIAGPLVGALLGFFLSAIISELVEAFLPSNLSTRVPLPEGKPVTLPREITIRRMEVTPEFVSFDGSWYVYINDPRPFYPRVSITDTIDRAPFGLPSKGSAEFLCTRYFGSLFDTSGGRGKPFEFIRQKWTSVVHVTLKTTAIPLPLTLFPWAIAVGCKIPGESGVHLEPRVVLTLGTLPITCTVWHPEPPLRGKTERRSFILNVKEVGDDGFTIDVPADAGCIILELSTHITDALGVSWNVTTQVNVPNETVSFGTDFEKFAKDCHDNQVKISISKVPSRLDTVWNPPEVLAKQVQEAILTEQPAISREINRVFATHGIQGIQVLLAPSLAGKM